MIFSTIDALLKAGYIYGEHIARDGMGYGVDSVSLTKGDEEISIRPVPNGWIVKKYNGGEKVTDIMVKVNQDLTEVVLGLAGGAK